MELSRKLLGNAKKLAIYERRSLGVNDASATLYVSAEGGSQKDQLEAEMADLRYRCLSALRLLRS